MTLSEFGSAFGLNEIRDQEVAGSNPVTPTDGTEGGNRKARTLSKCQMHLSGEPLPFRFILDRNYRVGSIGSAMMAVYTTRELASEFGKNESRIRQLARELKLGTCHGGRFRQYTDRDRSRLRKFFDDKGRDRA